MDERLAPTARAATAHPDGRLRPRRLRLRLGGSDGNERLTGAAAVALLVLLAAEGATIPFLGSLLDVHFFVGVLLVPPVALKLASVGYRFVRYYAGGTEYVDRGPPHLALRTLGPIVVVSTLVLFATGVALALVGPPAGTLLALHKASFIVWFFAMAVHVLAHTLELPRLAAADWRGGDRLGGSLLRRLALGASLGAGLALAAAVLPLVQPWLGGH